MLRSLPLAVLAVVAVAATGCASSPTTPVAPPSSAAPAAPTTAPAPATSAVPAASGSGADAYLAALRSAGVPVSKSDKSEVLIAQGVCQQIAKGVAPAKLADDLASGIPTLTVEQAGTMVQTATSTYC